MYSNLKLRAEEFDQRVAPSSGANYGDFSLGRTSQEQDEDKQVVPGRTYDSCCPLNSSTYK
jgi:hypothetical protein